MPWIKETTLSAEQLLTALKEMHSIEVQNVCKMFRNAGGILSNVQELGGVLARANCEAENEVMVKYGYTLDEFYSNMGLFLRQSPEFTQKKQEIDQEHRSRMVY